MYVLVFGQQLTYNSWLKIADLASTTNGRGLVVSKLGFGPRGPGFEFCNH